ncbi:MAG TPA: hypothetical protein VM450_12430 [Thermomicrobiales bacterium]|nr:hypothetical protein [Thermomicrobiales bacterium]
MAGEDLERAFVLREEISASVKAHGYRYVTLDLEGYRAGSLNLGLSPLVLHAARGKTAGE